MLVRIFAKLIGHQSRHDPVVGGFDDQADEADSSSSPIGIELSLGGSLSDPRDWRLNREIAGGGAMMSFGTAVIQSRSLTDRHRADRCYRSGDQDRLPKICLGRRIDDLGHALRRWLLTIYGSTSYSTRNLNQACVTQKDRSTCFIDLFEGVATKAKSTSTAAKFSVELDRIVMELNSNGFR